jgi:hypothetical protein
MSIEKTQGAKIAFREILYKLELKRKEWENYPFVIKSLDQLIDDVKELIKEADEGWYS